MSTPLTTSTGLRIGSKVDKQPQQPHHDRDALRLQRALLGETSRTDWDGLAIVAITLAGLLALVWSAA